MPHNVIMVTRKEYVYIVYVTAIECEKAPKVGNVTQSSREHTYDVVVVYSCPTGYWMKDPASPDFATFAEIRCLADKTWSSIPWNCTSEFDTLLQIVIVTIHRAVVDNRLTYLYLYHCQSL